MSLRRRGRVWHYEFELDGVRYRGTTRQTSKAAARDVEQRERARAGTVGPAPRSLTLREAAAAWWKAKGEHLRSADTIAHRLEILKRVLDFGTDVRDISTRTVADAIARRRGQTTHNGRRPTASTVNRDVIDTLRPILNHARRVLEQPDMPAIDWAALRLGEPRGRVREFTVAEIDAIRAALPEHQRDLFDFLATFGCRLREAWFPLSCLDTTDGRIFLRQRKGGDWHSIPLDRAWARRLGRRAGRARAAGLDCLWFWEDSAGRLHVLQPRSFQYRMRVVLTKLGIEDARPAHELRHHAGTQYVRRTGSLSGAQRLLGHEHIATTAKYAHASEQDVRKGLFGEESPQKPPQRRRSKP
jgi:site-specific recombinase XerD